jgi:hypothetical protein
MTGVESLKGGCIDDDDDDIGDMDDGGAVSKLTNVNACSRHKIHPGRRTAKQTVPNGPWCLDNTSESDNGWLVLTDTLTRFGGGATLISNN